MARRSVRLNHLEDKIRIVTGDIKEAAAIFNTRSSVVITVNPPYMIGSHGLKNENEALCIARHEVLCTLDDILRGEREDPGGQRTVLYVHRPFRLPEILRKMSEYRLEPKRMQLVYPQADKEPNMVLLEGLKGGKPRLKVEPPLIVYEKDGSYTRQIREAYSLDEEAGAAGITKKER